MAIEFKCPCGATCRADEAKAGELFHCEACGLDLPVPASGEAHVHVAEVVGEPPAGKAALSSSAAEEFKAARSADRTGFNEMMEQLHGVKAPVEVSGSPAAPAAGSSAAGSATAGSAAKAPAMAAGLRTRGPVKPATPVSRAAHHFGFKKLMWKPTLAVAGLCIVAGIIAFVLSARATTAPITPPGVVIKEPEVVTDAQGAKWAIPRGNTPSPHADGTMWSKDAQGREAAALQIVRDAADRAWAIPPGKTLTISKSGKAFYQDDSGFDVAAESAESWLNVQGDLDKRKAKDVGYQQGNIWFGVALVAVGLVLAGMSFWMRSDVRQALREQAK
ncbi:MAG: hypothetical protein NTX87_19700 [Planctomycetota bacterium]|nr:hypothetical protein [Planctomycetota bacterium]